MQKTVVYSTRIDPKVIASLAHLYDLKKWRYRSASDLMNHALTTFKDYLVVLESDKGHSSSLEFEDMEEAVAYLLNNPRLDTVQLMKDFGFVLDRELSAREQTVLSDHDKVVDIDWDSTMNDPAIQKRMEELSKVKRSDGSNSKEVKRKKELMKKQEESAQQTK